MGITLDEVVLDASTSSVSVEQATHDSLNANANLQIGDVDVGAGNPVPISDNSGSITVDAVDLDIRNLINTQDSIAVGDETNIVDMAIMDSAFGLTSVGFPIMGVRQDAGGSPVSATGDAHPLVFDNAGQLKVATSLTSSVADDSPSTENGILQAGVGRSGLLAALSADGDKFDLIGDLYRRVFVNNAYNVGIEVTTETVGATAAQIVATPMAGRKSVTIQNSSSNSIWLGHDATVTADDTATGGVEIKKNTTYSDDFGENIDIYLISDGAGRTVKVLEKG